MKCPNCKVNEARHHPQLGILPCTDCSNIPHLQPHNQIEFTSDSIKDQRKEFATDFLPAHRKGELDKGFVERYGVKKAIQQGFTAKEIKSARYVWDPGKNL